MNVPDGVDCRQLCAELIRALRGRRSQMALSRRLGYRTNVLYLWEAKKGAPTAAGFFALARRAGVDVEASLQRFYRDPPPWMRQLDPVSPEGAAALLRDLKGNATLVDVARSLRRSRYALSRWLDGSAEPRLPDFLQAIEVTSLRLLDFVACFADPEQMPSVSDRWRQLQLSRRAAYERPWSHAVLRALELDGYVRLPRHEPGWIAQRLGLSREEEEESLRVLSSSGQIELLAGRWVPRGDSAIDTRRDPRAARQLKAWWFDVGTERYRGEVPGVFSYNLFGVSALDFERIQALQRSYFREIRSIVAQSQPVETVALVNLQLFSLLDPAEPGAGST
jgi:hypothetical protein